MGNFCRGLYHVSNFCLGILFRGKGRENVALRCCFVYCLYSFTGHLLCSELRACWQANTALRVWKKKDLTKVLRTDVIFAWPCLRGAGWFCWCRGPHAGSQDMGGSFLPIQVMEVWSRKEQDLSSGMFEEKLSRQENILLGRFLFCQLICRKRREGSLPNLKVFC